MQEVLEIVEELRNLSGNAQIDFLKKHKDNILLKEVLFYTYNGAIGKSPDWVNIAIFFVSAGACYAYEYKCFKNQTICKRALFAFIGLIAVAALFILFSYLPPKIPLFKDPISGLYGF